MDRKCRGCRVGYADRRRRPPDERQRHEVDVVAGLREHLIAVGADQNLIGWIGLGARARIGVAGDLEIRAPVGAVVANRDQPLGAGVVVNPTRIPREVRSSPSIVWRDARGRSPSGRQPHELVSRSEMRRESLAAGSFYRHNPLPIGRPDRRVVKRGVCGETYRRPTGHPYLVDRAPGIAPRDVCQP